MVRIWLLSKFTQRGSDQAKVQPMQGFSEHLILLKYRYPRLRTHIISRGHSMQGIASEACLPASFPLSPIINTVDPERWTIGDLLTYILQEHFNRLCCKSRHLYLD